MFDHLRKRIFGPRSRKAALDLPSVAREKVSHLWNRPDGLPRVDWSMADHWIAQHADPGRSHGDWRRAVMAACLDELRDSLPQDHRRWRSPNVEGLAPLQGSTGAAMAVVAERSFKSLRKDLRIIRGDDPIPPIAIVAIEPEPSYIDFTNSYFPDEGAFAVSGGLYLSEEASAFPLIAINAHARHGCEAGVVHELTHHALHAAGLPPWVEEGFTQMMEERIARTTNFKLNAEMVARQRELWSEHDIDDFLDGSAFYSPISGVQELSYHLAQWVVRGELTRRPDLFFQFARNCRTTDPEESCQEALGTTPRSLVQNIIGIDDE